jgi:DNA-binding MarR family transcriptional regulator
MSATVKPTATTLSLSERELHAWRGMLRVHAWLTKALDGELEAAHGLSLSSYEVLMYLDRADDQRMRMCDLAESVILSRSGLTRLVDRLERDGLLCRESCPSDARGAYAKLTPAGAAKIGEARPTHLAGVRSLFLDRLSANQQEHLHELWARIVPNATDSSGPACG